VGELEHGMLAFIAVAHESEGEFSFGIVLLA
jgi:hypothetical protein